MRARMRKLAIALVPFLATAAVAATLLDNQNTVTVSHKTFDSTNTWNGSFGGTINLTGATCTGCTLAGTTTNTGTISGGAISSSTLTGTTTNSGTLTGGTLGNFTLNGTLTGGVGTLTSMTIGSSVLASTNTINANSGLFTLVDNLDNTKRIQFITTGISSGATRSWTFPDFSGTFLSASGTQSVSNKTFTGTTTNSGTFAGGTYTDVMLTSPVIGTSGAPIVRVLSNSASLDFAATAANSCDSLTITVTGSITGDPCNVGAPIAAVSGNISYWCVVSAADTVAVRRCNVATSAAPDPAAATFRVMVTQF